MFNFAEAIKNAEPGKTHVFSAGQAGFIVKSASGQLLGIDLYLSDCVERVEGHIGYKRMLPRILDADELDFDVIIATHFHRDHFDMDAIPTLMKNEKTMLYAATDCKQDVVDLKIDQQRVSFVKPGDNAVYGDFEIHFINCDHGTGAPEAVGVALCVDEKKILEIGDSCLRLDRVEEYRSYGPYSLMIAPINGAYGNLNERDCAVLASQINPGIVIPCHYGMFASHGGHPGQFKEIMENEYPDQKFLIMTMGEKITL